MRIGILGGTFDPVHNGHLELARAALNQYKLDQVLFIPSNIPPHKTLRQDTASAEHRYQMVSLALGHDPKFAVSRIETSRPGISYTSETLKLLRKEHPDDTLFLILGADAHAGFTEWRDAELIKSYATLLVASRSGAGKELSSLPAGVLRIDMPEYPVASTDVRARISSSVYHELKIPASVLEYIRSHNLYSR